ncbi:MAG: WGR domain-containing protein [Sphingomonadaceae bacterium]|jgi:predicted DNA-binding WGR domain protein|nr:WGR domain-containing protein [Sphingomonadaceae bacterium]
MSAVYLTRINANENMRRFYRLDVQQTLFGEFALVREWGRIGRGGQVRSTPFPTRGQADVAMAKLYASKARRGYRCLNR